MDSELTQKDLEFYERLEGLDAQAMEPANQVAASFAAAARCLKAMGVPRREARESLITFIEGAGRWI